MIKLKDLIDNARFEDVWQEFILLYPDFEKRKNVYINIFENLLMKDSNNNEENMIIHIIKRENDEEAENLEYQVHGKNDSKEKDGLWDISASSWSDWLGFFIDDNIFETLNNEQIVALCMWEMSWFGGTESDVIDKVKKLSSNE